MIPIPMSFILYYSIKDMGIGIILNFGCILFALPHTLYHITIEQRDSCS